MAMSGMLQNFAAGVMILFQKQYSVGDFVELQSYSGIVKEIRMFSTTINTFDNKKIIIPNSVIATNVITNFTSEKTRRVEWRINIYYGADFDKAKNALIELIGKDKRLLEDKEMLVLLHSFGESSACIVARAWINSDDYWDVYFDYNEAIYKRFNEIGIEFHVPQMGVHISHQNQKT
jgi:small conductance mechanosensitive channel